MHKIYPSSPLFPLRVYLRKRAVGGSLLYRKQFLGDCCEVARQFSKSSISLDDYNAELHFDPAFCTIYVEFADEVNMTAWVLTVSSVN